MTTTSSRTRARAAADAAGELRWASVLDDADCAVCGTAVPHELVECVDGHGEDCPDVVCTACGTVAVTARSPLARAS